MQAYELVLPRRPARPLEIDISGIKNLRQHARALTGPQNCRALTGPQYNWRVGRVRKGVVNFGFMAELTASLAQGDLALV